jgi:glycosyltransferase involved in cell wall biosynthesis
VDDGSTDDTRAVVDRLATTLDRPVSYVHQENKGAYGARNTGVNEARGTHIAFFDSDDLWLPHHLARCMSGFEAHPDLDWIFGSCTRIDHASGRVIDQNVFYVDGRPRPFLSLRTRRDDDLHIFDDPSGTECQILHGFFCGLQNSVIHRRVFDGRRFHEQYKVCEDELFLIRVLVAGARLAYYMEPHVIYRVHELNSSASNGTQVDDKTLAIFRELVDGFEELLAHVPLATRDRRAARRRLSREYFWHLGYHGLLPAGRRAEAMRAFRRGIGVWPWDWHLWKTYVATALRPSARGAHA